MTPEQIVLTTCLKLKQDERFLIVTDKNKKELAERFLSEAKKKTLSVELVEISETKVNGEEPPASCAEKMLESDVIIMITTKSLSWTEARVNASKNCARIASMPSITQDIIDRTLNVDYDSMKEMTNRIADLLDKGNMIRIITDLGTDLKINISGMVAHGRKSGLYDKNGYWGNLPSGEAFISPVPDKTDGSYVVDASQAGIGKITEPIRVAVKDGFAVEITGEKQAEELKNMLESVNDKEAYNVAEFGIGTNPNAKVIGVVLEDEKVMGTCHIALGKNSGFGGNVDVPIHSDGVINAPTIYLDDKMIMDKGKLLI